MSKRVIKITKGANISLQGAPEKKSLGQVISETYVLKPSDFHGLVPKLKVKVGDEVMAGTPLFVDKKNENIAFCSPVSGEVVDVIRGEKRALLAVKVLADKEIRYKNFTTEDISRLSRDKIISKLMEAGLWAFVRQRPFSVIANPTEDPKDIYVSGFDSSPLAPDYSYALQEDKEYIQAGFEVLSRLTHGKTYLGLDADQESPAFLTQLKNVEINYFSGKHPKGNVGVQIHHTDPINKGDVVWYVDIQNVVFIGKLFKQGKYDVSKVIALTGSELSETGYAKTIGGGQIKSILGSRVKTSGVRYISGNVLTGDKVGLEDYLGFYHDQLTVIPEANTPAFFGWALPTFNKLSFSRSNVSWLMPGKQYRLDTGMNGEERAFVVTGELERFLPMDIYPMQLLKAIMVNDIEKMEQLGIYEVAPEDFALCEFACTSKIDIQEVVRQGLDTVKEEC